jgi:hypothetical protein
MRNSWFENRRRLEGEHPKLEKRAISTHTNLKRELRPQVAGTGWRTKRHPVAEKGQQATLADYL